MTRRACAVCLEDLPTETYGVHLALAHPGVREEPLPEWTMRDDIDTSPFGDLPPWVSYVSDPAGPRDLSRVDVAARCRVKRRAAK